MVDFKATRTGEQRRARNGLLMKIVYYEREHSVWVQFSDGSYAGECIYSNFKKGRIEHPDDTPKMQAILRLGETVLMNDGRLGTIIAYRRAVDIDVLLSDGSVVNHVHYTNFKNGSIGTRRKLTIKHSNRVGQSLRMKCGLMATITRYNSATDIEVTFDNGEKVIHRTYSEFLRKCLSPNRWQVKQHIGEVQMQNCGRTCEIIDFRNTKDIDVLLKDDNLIVRHREYREFLHGGINPKGSAYWYNGSYNELWCAEFFKSLGFRKYDKKFYQSIGMGRKEIDLYNPTIKVAIEYDGQRFHQDVEKDKQKDGLLMSLGITLYRIRERYCPAYQSNNARLYYVNNPRNRSEDLITICRAIWNDIAKQHYPHKWGDYPLVDDAVVAQQYHTTQADYKKHIGEKIINHAGREMTLLAWHNNKNIELLVEGYPHTVTNYSYEGFSKGYQPKIVTQYFRKSNY